MSDLKSHLPCSLQPTLPLFWAGFTHYLQLSLVVTSGFLGFPFVLGFTLRASHIAVAGAALQLSCPCRIMSGLPEPPLKSGW